MIYSDRIQDYQRLCAGAEKLGSEVSAFTIGTASDGETVSKLCGKTYLALMGQGRTAEDYFPAFLDIVKSELPDLIIIGATKRGKLVASRLASRLNIAAMTDVFDISACDGSVICKQMYYGGAAVSTLKSIGSTALITVGSGAFDGEKQPGPAGEVINIDFKPHDNGVVLKNTMPKEVESVNLALAKRIVGIGRGVLRKEDIKLAEELASAIGAELGCSRPISEGEGWMAGSRYIGVSGITVKPDLYIAAGISGQIQHTIGVGSAKTIIAINKDKNAPIFKICDYGIVGDLYKIIPALTTMIQKG